MFFGKRALQVFVTSAVAFALAACAGHRPKAAETGGVQPATVAGKGGAHGYRFDMTQNGRKMSADDFAAWMKANGLHVAKGKASASDGRGRAGAKAKPAPTPAKVATTAAGKKPSRD